MEELETGTGCWAEDVAAAFFDAIRESQSGPRCSHDCYTAIWTGA